MHGIFASLHVKMDERHCVLKQLHKEIQTKEKISEELREEIKLRSTENAKQEALLVNTQTRVNDITGSMEYMSLDNVLTEANEEEAELNKYYDECKLCYQLLT